MLNKDTISGLRLRLEFLDGVCDIDALLFRAQPGRGWSASFKLYSKGRERLICETGVIHAQRGHEKHYKTIDGVFADLRYIVGPDGELRVSIQGKDFR